MLTELYQNIFAFMVKTLEISVEGLRGLIVMADIFKKAKYAAIL